MSEPMTPKQRSDRARVAAATRWAMETNRTKAVQPAVDARLRAFERQADPDCVLSPEVRRKHAEELRRAHMLSLAFRSSRGRQARRATGGAA